MPVAQFLLNNDNGVAPIKDPSSKSFQNMDGNSVASGQASGAAQPALVKAALSENAAWRLDGWRVRFLLIKQLPMPLNAT